MTRKTTITDELARMLVQHCDEIAQGWAKRILRLPGFEGRNLQGQQLESVLAEVIRTLSGVISAPAEVGVRTSSACHVLQNRLLLSPPEALYALLQYRAEAVLVLQRIYADDEQAGREAVVKIEELILDVAAVWVQGCGVEAQEREAEQSSRMSMMLRVVRAAMGVTDLDEALMHITSEIASVVPGGQGAFYLLDERRFFPPLDPEPEYPPLVDDMIGEIISARKPVVSYDASRDARVAQQIRAVAGFKSSLGVPLILRGRVVGVVLVVTEELHEFTREEIEQIQELANPAALAIENVLLYREAQQVAIVEERSRIAGELHDGSNQLIAAALFGVQAALEELRNGTVEGSIEELQGVKHVLAQVASQNRLIISGLHLPTVSEQGLVSALQWYADSFAARRRIPCTLEVVGRVVELADEQANAAYRVVQEALNNAAAHAKATSVRIRVTFEPTRLCVRVQDDGRGFDQARKPGAGRMGLLGMRERAHSVGGTLDVQSAPGEGTLVEICMPLNGRAQRLNRSPNGNSARRPGSKLS